MSFFGFDYFNVSRDKIGVFDFVQCFISKIDGVFMKGIKFVYQSGNGVRVWIGKSGVSMEKVGGRVGYFMVCVVDLEFFKVCLNFGIGINISFFVCFVYY